MVPEKPNGYKKELFIFDSFKFTANSAVVCVPRELEFSPLKNGNDSETDNQRTCMRDYKNAAILEKALSFAANDDLNISLAAQGGGSKEMPSFRKKS